MLGDHQIFIGGDRHLNQIHARTHAPTRTQPPGNKETFDHTWRVTGEETSANNSSHVISTYESHTVKISHVANDAFTFMALRF